MPEFGAVHDEERAGDSRIMSSALRVCRKCGAEIFADAPEGVCTACLFETGLGLLTSSSVAGVDDPGHGNKDHSDKAAAQTKTPTEFGDYDLIEEIGRGGQGVVYRARQKSLNRTVALKVIGLGQWASTPHLKRFRQRSGSSREVRASADCADLRNRRTRRFVLLQHEIRRGRPVRASSLKESQCQYERRRSY